MRSGGTGGKPCCGVEMTIGKRRRECWPGTAQGLRPQGEAKGKGEGSGWQETGADRKVRSTEQGQGLALSCAPGEFSLTAGYPP